MFTEPLPNSAAERVLNILPQLRVMTEVEAKLDGSKTHQKVVEDSDSRNISVSNELNSQSKGKENIPVKEYSQENPWKKSGMYIFCWFCPPHPPRHRNQYPLSFSVATFQICVVWKTIDLATKFLITIKKESAKNL